MAMLLGIPNSSYITLDNIVGYGYEFQRNLDKRDIRTKGGSLFTYITPAGGYNSFKLPATFVNSSDRSLVNSWFESGADLRFIEDDTFANSYYNVRITGTTDSFTRFVQPYFRQLYSGTITLETI
jgi:hypothetical protein